jgi:uncharacterized alpha-E superfamily protein
MLSRRFPRSVRYCLDKAERSLHAITGTPLGTSTNPVERELGRLNAEIAYAEIGDILQRGLHEHIDDLQRRMNKVGDAVWATFFAMKPIDLSAGEVPQDRESVVGTQ